MKRAVLVALPVIIPVLALSACGNSGNSTYASKSKSSSDASIVGVLWQWNGLEETMPATLSAVPKPENYLLTLNDDGTFGAKADCNNLFGEYTLSGSNLTFTLGPMTKALCPPDSLSDTYVHLLGQVSGYNLAQGQLSLKLKDNAGSMFFNAA